MEKDNNKNFEDKIFNEYKPFFIATSSCEEFEKKKQDKRECKGFLLEATTFLVFKKIYNHDIKINERRNRKGPDFLIENNGAKCYVEATHLRKKAEKKRTGLPDNLQSSSVKACHFYPDLQKLRATIDCKNSQITGDCPSVLCIGTYNPYGWLLRSPNYTRRLFYLEPKRGTEGDIVEWSSFYLRIKIGVEQPDIEILNRNVSAILFFTVSSDLGEIRINGILHPSPHREFDIVSLPGIPFWKLNGVRMKNEDIQPDFDLNQDKIPSGIALVERLNNSELGTAAIDMNELLSQ